MTTLSPAVRASGLTLETRRGSVFRDVDLVVMPGELAMLVGATGSGKTALLLAIAGRMGTSGGSLEVLGTDARRSPAAARRATALALLDGVNDLADPLTVRDTVRAELLLFGMRATPGRVADVLARAGIADRAPHTVADLTAVERSLLGVALALVGSPAIIVVDDIDHDLTPSEQARLKTVLRAIADAGTTVIGACIDPRAAAGADHIFELHTPDGSEVETDAIAESR